VQLLFVCGGEWGGDGEPSERRDLEEAESPGCRRAVEGEAASLQALRQCGFNSLRAGRDLPVWLTNTLSAALTLQKLRSLLKTWTLGDSSSLVASIRRGYVASNPQKMRDGSSCVLEAGRGAAAGLQFAEESSGAERRAPRLSAQRGLRCFTNAWGARSMGVALPKAGRRREPWGITRRKRQEMGRDGKRELGK